MGGRDDLGAAWLAAHPRGEQWQELDVTVSALTFDQVGMLAETTEYGGAEDQARRRARPRVIAGLDPEVAGRLGSRWVRWCSTFGLDLPAASSLQSPDQVLWHPYDLVERTAGELGREWWARFVWGVSALFDAALGVAAAGLDPSGWAAHAALTGPWARVCLPCRFGPGDVFGSNA